MHRAVLTVIVAFVAASPLLAGGLKAGIPDGRQAEAGRLVEQLGDRSYTVREAASKRLIELGRPALGPLDAARQSPVPEVVARATALHARIADKVENDALTAGTPVKLSDEPRKLSDLFREIEKQTRYRLRVNGDQAILAQRVTPTAGTRTFWETVLPLVESLGLEVESSTGLSGPLNAADGLLSERSDISPAERRDDALRARWKELRVENELYEKRIELIGKKMEALGEKHADLAPLATELVRMKSELRKIANAIREIEDRLEVGPDRPLGTVVLRAKEHLGRIAGCVSGAARIEVMPTSDDFRKRTRKGDLAVELRVVPEPRFRWRRVEEVLVRRAVDDAGRELLPRLVRDTLPDSMVDDPERWSVAPRRLSSSIEFEATPTTPACGTVSFLPPVGAKANRLKELSGTVRVSVWVEEPRLVSVSNLAVGAESLGSGPNDTHLSVKVSRANGVVQLAVTCRHDPTAVSRDPGVRLFDRAGTAIDLRPTRVETRTVTVGIATGVERVTVFVLPERMALPDVVAVGGQRVRTISFPFRLTDVPLVEGTGDALPRPAFNWKR